MMRSREEIFSSLAKRGLVAQVKLDNSVYTTDGYVRLVSKTGACVGGLSYRWAPCCCAYEYLEKVYGAEKQNCIDTLELYLTIRNISTVHCTTTFHNNPIWPLALKHVGFKCYDIIPTRHGAYNVYLWRWKNPKSKINETEYKESGIVLDESPFIEVKDDSTSP